MLYVLTCSCGEKHHISLSQAGQEINCGCGKSIRIPTLRGIRDLPPVSHDQDAEGQPAGVKAATQSTWRGWRGPLLACTTGISLVTALACGYFLVQRLRVDTSFNEESALEVGQALLDQYGPYELSYVWSTYQNYGLGPKARPNYYLWNKYAEELTRMAIIFGSLAIAFGGIAAGLAITAPGTAAASSSGAD